MEMYQWLIRKNGFSVSDTGYFVYANGKASRDGFNARLEFDVTIIPYTGNAGWVDKTINDIAKSLKAKKPPAAGKGCDYCAYIRAVLNSDPILYK